MNTTPDNPGHSRLMQWIQLHISYEHDWCLIWPFGRRAGYGFLVRDGKTHSAHRYICELIHGPAPEGYVAAHSCGRGHEACVNPRHISWKTNSGNQLDRKNHKGGPRYRLRPYQILEIRALKGLERPVDTAQRFAVSESAIRQVQTGKTWKPGNPTNNFTDEQVRHIRSLQGIKTGTQVGAEYGVRHSVIYKIWNRQSWAHVPDLAQPSWRGT